MAEGEVVLGLQPAEIGCTEGVEGPDIDHADASLLPVCGGHGR
jgi:hypothetical protein